MKDRSMTISSKTTSKTSEPNDAAKPAKVKKVAKPAEGRKPNALQQPLQPSDELAAVVGPDRLARGEAVSKVWIY
ncbi:MAG: hypothetical protein EOP02_25175, partial [Proteobacteria bacterium]